MRSDSKFLWINKIGMFLVISLLLRIRKIMNCELFVSVLKNFPRKANLLMTKINIV